ncbi:hypothetical protein OG474_00195 [Kribbella sp. NBC_01505]|uniref:hypothetical protein n=1 Tax=Kribbella sp. NBC_01505 TaxID=2903580 RepID=UPI0038667C65
MAEGLELAVVDSLLRRSEVWAEPPEGLEQRIRAGLSTRPECTCPDCGGPARIADRFILYRESGPELHLRSVCRASQHFDLPDRADE